MSRPDWIPVQPWRIPEGITLHTFAILYRDGAKLVSVGLAAPSLNLAVRRFAQLGLGDLVEVRVAAQKEAAC
jgi:hypothetical protein